MNCTQTKRVKSYKNRGNICGRNIENGYSQNGRQMGTSHSHAKA